MQKKGIDFQKEIMSSLFYPTGSGFVVQCMPVGGAKFTQITTESQMQRHLLAESCILFLGPKVRGRIKTQNSSHDHFLNQ